METGKRFTVVLDAGHGGFDPGATFNGLNEKDINLKVCLSLRSLILQSTKDITPILTRETDIYIPLRKRCRIANDQGAGYYLSIHCNADMDEDLPGMPEAHGEEIWYCKGSTKGKLYAEAIASTIDRIFHDEPFRGIKETPYLYVLKHTLAPANLVELGFIDNSNTNREFKDPKVIQDIAKCLYESIQLIAQLNT